MQVPNSINHPNNTNNQVCILSSHRHSTEPIDPTIRCAYRSTLAIELVAFAKHTNPNRFENLLIFYKFYLMFKFNFGGTNVIRCFSCCLFKFHANENNIFETDNRWTQLNSLVCCDQRRPADERSYRELFRRSCRARRVVRPSGRPVSCCLSPSRCRVRAVRC